VEEKCLKSRIEPSLPWGVERSESHEHIGAAKSLPRSATMAEKCAPQKRTQTMKWGDEIEDHKARGHAGWRISDKASRGLFYR